MQKRSETFGLVLESIPHINLRNEFARYYTAVNDPDFRKQFKGKIEPIETPYMVWYGMPDDLITLIFQRVVMGVESYLRGATYFQLGRIDKLKENLSIIKNPFELKGNGTVDNFYHKLPSLVDESYSLKNSNPTLYQTTKDFYREVRNPVFHGNLITQRNISALRKVFEYLKEIYEWIDGWHDLDMLFGNNGE